MQADFRQIEDLKQLAERAYDENRMAAVVELLPQFLDFFPNDSRAWFLYGDAQRVLGRKGAAAVSLRNAEKSCPPEHKWAVQGRLGLLFHDKGDFAAAERWFCRALESDEAQETSWLWVFRGANFSVQELLEEAEQCYRRAIVVNEQDDEAYLNLAMVCRSQGKYEQAKSAAETALALCPDYPAATEVVRSLEGVDESRRLVATLRRIGSE
jgi:tetratricopeptide (TPR) repeat protein